MKNILKHFNLLLELVFFGFFIYIVFVNPKLAMPTGTTFYALLCGMMALHCGHSYAFDLVKWRLKK